MSADQVEKCKVQVRLPHSCDLTIILLSDKREVTRYVQRADSLNPKIEK